MSNRKVLVTETHLEDIADAIREKNGRIDTYTPAEMADAIEAIPTSATLIQKTVTQNGVYDPQDDDADGYSLLSVNVSGGGGADLEGNLAPAYEDLTFPVYAGQHCVYMGQYYIAQVDISTSGSFDPNDWAAMTVDDDVADLNARINAVCLDSYTATTLTVGTTTVTLDGVTADHIVVGWGFSTGDANNPPADLSITTSNGSYTITVSRVYVTGASVAPIFILPWYNDELL